MFFRPRCLTIFGILLFQTVLQPAPAQTAATSPLLAPAKLVPTPPQLDVSYGDTSDGQKLLLDIFQPPGPAAGTPAAAASNLKLRPAVLMVHGGGWAGGNKKEFRNLAVLMAQLGYVTVPVSYRLTSNPVNTWPAQLDDVQLAVRWLRANAGTYSIDPHRIGAVGMSAGGQLVASLGLRETRDPATAKFPEQSSRVNCVVDVCGPTDLSDDFPKKVKQGEFVNGLINRLFGGPASEKAPAVTDASPLTHVDAKAPPFLIIHGKADELVPFDHSQRLHEALQKGGTSSRFIGFENDGHVFKERENQKRFLQETIVFFNQQLKP
jgi:acetyl esterase/lipase